MTLATATAMTAAATLAAIAVVTATAVTAVTAAIAVLYLSPWSLLQKTNRFPNLSLNKRPTLVIAVAMAI